jgi:hypothetical protein
VNLCNKGRAIDWFDAKQGEGRWFLDRTAQIKKHRDTLRRAAEAVSSRILRTKN